MVEFNKSDLSFILTQIQMAEAGQPPVNALLSFGLRTVDGTYNNLVPGQQTFGSVDQLFPRVTDPLLQSADYGTSYAQYGGLVIDGDPRLISNLIADQTASNPAAVAAAEKALGALGDGYASNVEAGEDGRFGTADDVIHDPLSGGTIAVYAGADGRFGTGAGGVDDDMVVAAGDDGVLGTADDVRYFAGADNHFETADDRAVRAGKDGLFGTEDDVTTQEAAPEVTYGNLATPTYASSSGATIPGLQQSLFINNVPPDAGLSAPYSSLLTYFGQFFDHGLDLVTKGGSGTVFIPLSPDDPLYVPGGHSNFMVLTRATDQPGPDGKLGTADDIHDSRNVITPFVDQSQTYSSHPSHQVFLREYVRGADGQVHSTGALLSHRTAGADGVLHTADDVVTMATWADVKAQAATMLGIRLTDADVGNVPLLATDAYGNFLRGANGLVQLVVRNADGTTSLVEGNLDAPISTANAVRTGVAFINDMAHSASPVDDFGAPLAPDMDTVAGGTPATGFYDNELLDAHYAAGDGRVNENIGLTAVQNIFHSEHNRLLAQTKALIQAQLDDGDISFATDWVLPGVSLLPTLNADGTTTPHQITDAEWNGERLFQVAKFGTETQYQHLVFEEFARMVDPAVHVFGNIDLHIDAAITAEFAHVVYRFGHSMLDENLNIYELDPATGKPVIDPSTGQPKLTEMGLIQAFTNPLAFAQDSTATADLVLGAVNQVGNEIDEFVTGSLRNNLLGLPLDLAALNIARGRDTGVAPLNLVRNQLFAETLDSQLKPYESWDEFGRFLKHPESLVNFVAAYGIHDSLSAATSLTAKREAAAALVHLGTVGDAFDPSNAASRDAFDFMHSLGAYGSDKHDVRAIHDAKGAEAQWGTGSVTGLDQIDMWIGGLAEKQNLFGGLLGSTFEFIFRTQLEALQDGDRLYYLPRIEGMHYATEIEANSFASIIRENTGIKHLPGNIFRVPEYTLEATTYFETYKQDVFDADGHLLHKAGDYVLDDAGNHVMTDSYGWLHNPQTGQLIAEALPDGSVHFYGDNLFLGNTIVLGGTENDDKLYAGNADDDAVWGDGGNDLIDGGGGNDDLYGGDGQDTLFGGQGDDIIRGENGDDSVSGGDGLDAIFGGNGNDTLSGGRGADAIDGGTGNDIIRGGEGDDELTGDEGDDWIEGGTGGDLLVGDAGAPTGQTPLYDGNDVLIGGPGGGDRMQGFNGDDIMLGVGSFDKFEGRLGFDWASYEQATQGVDADLTRREFIAVNGAVDTIRDFFIAVEGVSGSAFDDVIKGSDASKLLTTKDELSNVNLINGLAGFFDPGVVAFDGGNIILGGRGSDSLIGGGGDDIIDGDAWLHVSLTNGGGEGAQIRREILYDPDGNTWTPDFFDPAAGSGHVNPANVDVAVFTDVMANYNLLLIPDAEGFLTVQHVPNLTVPSVSKVDDGTDRIRHIERLQFADTTVAIDPNGNFLNPLVALAEFDAVPVGSPLVTAANGADPTVLAQVGTPLNASIAVLGAVLGGLNSVQPGQLFDADGVGPIHLQWQALDVLRNVWVPIAGATGASFTPTTFQAGEQLRVVASYVDGKGVQESVASTPTALVTFDPTGNTPPFLVQQQQLNGIQDTTGNQGQLFDYFIPLTTIFNDHETLPAALTYTATRADGSPLPGDWTFTFPYVDPVTGTTTGSARLTGTLPPEVVGPYGIKVTATDPGGLSVTDTFVINVLPDLQPPSITLGLAHDTGTFANDGVTFDPRVTGTTEAGATVTVSIDGGPALPATVDAQGRWSFLPVVADGDHMVVATATDAAGNHTSVSLHILVDTQPPVIGATLAHDTGASAQDGITADPAIAGTADPGTTVRASIDGGPAADVATGGADGSWSFTPVLADGPHTVVVSQADLAGNVGSAMVAMQLDTTPPALAVALVADTGVSATDGITRVANLSGSGDPSSTVQLSIDLGPVVSVATDAAGHWTYAPVLGEGPHHVAVTETDLAGNAAGAVLDFVLDTIAPTLALGAVSYTSTATALTGYTLTGTAEAGSSVTVASGGAKLGAAVAAADGSWSVAVTPATGTGFQAVLDITATDIAGNVGAASHLGLIVGTNAAGVHNAAGAFLGIPDLILGLGSNDVLTGGSGADTLDGGTGSDAMSGGAGDDTYVVDSATDVVTEQANAGTDTVRTTLTAYQLGSNVENLVFTGAGNFAGTGNALANAITGGIGNDTLTGGLNTGPAGDTLTGGLGNDTYVVSNQADTVTEQAGGGTDTVRTTLASYTLGTAVENLTFTGTGSFTGIGNALANAIAGGAGDDRLEDGGGGPDTLAGGGGNDLYIVSVTGDVVTEAAGAGIDTVRTTLAAYTLGSNLERLEYAGGGSFAGTGNSLANAILGGSGNDVLSGIANSVGVDTLTGGAGDDLYILGNLGDVVVEQAGGGIDTVQTARASHVLAANVENLVYTGIGAFTGTGNALANAITGGVGADTLAGGKNDAGVDTLTGGAGNDTYDVSNAGDVIVELAGGGTDTVRTVLGSYTLGAELENLTFTGTGNFAGTGNGLSNSITGGAGNDTLDGGANLAGGDRLTGGLGDDTYIVRNAADVITEAAGAGTDTVLTSLSSLVLATNVENLTYTGAGAFTGTGNALNNVITGGALNDVLSGGGGADTLIGGAGADTLTGGAAGDLFMLLRGDANGDLITDFARTGANGPDHIAFAGYVTAAVPLSHWSLAKLVAGSAAAPTIYAVQRDGVTQDTFFLTGNVTLTAADYDFR